MTTALQNFRSRCLDIAGLAASLGAGLALLGACSASVDHGSRVAARTEGQPLVVNPSVTRPGTDTVEADLAARLFTNYSIAALAAADSDHSLAADYFARAHAVAPRSNYIAERAFVGQVYAGDIDGAMAIAARMVHTEDSADELVQLLYVLQAYASEDWADVRMRSDRVQPSGFGFIVTPVLVAWSHAAEGDLVAAREALAPLDESPSLQAIADEFYTYMVDHVAAPEQVAGAYSDLLSRETLPSLQPVIAFADFLVRHDQEKDARALLTQQLERFPGNNFLQREAYRSLYLGGPSHRVYSPRGAASMLFYRLGSELSQNENGDAAVIYLQLARYFAPQVADIHILLGSTLDQLERFSAAAAAYGRVDVNDPSYASARLRRVEALRRSGRGGEAAALIEAALQEKPRDQQLLGTLADLYRSEGRLEEAEDYYDRLIKMVETPGKSDWWLFFSRGAVREQLDRWADAEDDLLTALRLNPDQPELLNYLGYSWADRGHRIDEARGMIAKAAEQRPESGAVIDSLGWVHFLIGDYDEAIRLLERAVHLEPADPVINAHLGDAYWKAGREREARFQWRHALTLGPESEAEKRALEHKLDLGFLEMAEDRTTVPFDLQALERP